MSEEQQHFKRPAPFTGGSVPPDFNDFSGPLCEDPACYRKRPHFPREYGCRWSNVAVVGRDGVVTIFEKPQPPCTP